MAAFMTRCVCLSALLLHSILLYVSSIHGLESENYNLIHMQEIDLNPQISPFLAHHRFVRSHNDRVKRQVVSTLEFQRTITENDTGVIFQLDKEPQFSDPHRFVLTSATVPDLFVVDQTSGSVYVQPGKRLDYEDVNQRSIQLKVSATNTNNITAVTEVTLTITVTDINDEAPTFKNKPFPYLTTVGVSTPANKEVYQLLADDPDTNADISYKIDSGDDGRFAIKTETAFVDDLGINVKVGKIYTQGQDQFKADHEYRLTCIAIDNNANPVQTTTATVYVKVGFRAPQFYENPFRATVRENGGIDQMLNNEFKIKAEGFQDHPITYELRNAANSSSTRFSIAADGTVKTLQVFDYESVSREQRPKNYELNVFATETVTGLQSTAKLFVEVLDDNDNSPIFVLSRYSKQIPENLKIGQSVTEVKAVDDDSGTNAELVYSVDDDNFDVKTENRSTSTGMEYFGTIIVKQRLDYDRLSGHRYSFTVTARDKGSPSASGTANVRVFMTNVNDEPPEIILGDPKVKVREDAQSGSPVTVIQAVDLDKDQVSLYFSPKNTKYEIFEIIPSSGLIRLAQSVPADRDQYVLNITAVDDGSCCGGTDQLSSEANLIVEIVDINTHKPSFPNCAAYNNNATIIENEPVSTLVIHVQAVDDDRGLHGDVKYSILRLTTDIGNYFNINDTGHLTSGMKFDRESQSSYSVTVKGTDQGEPPLDGYCTFRVTIGDVNDNAPKFDLPTYTATISDSYQIGRSVISVRADDADLGVNAEITYEMVDSDGGYFRIEQDAGIIFLNTSLGSQNTYNLQVMAKDKGSPSLNKTVSVTVTVTKVSSQPPKWDRIDYDKDPKTVDETAEVGYIIGSYTATSNVDDPDVSFALIDSDGHTVQQLPPFAISSGGNTVNLTVFSTMDFNKKNRYELRLRVANRGTIPLSSEIHPVIELRDTNNKIPYFRGLDETTYYPGSIPENDPSGETVIEIKAYDEDPTPPNNLLFYEIVDDPGVSDKFSIKRIDDNTAVLKTSASFDREEVDQLYVKVRVKDGIESSRPGHTPGQPNTAVATVQVRITDRNDNPPYFESSYNASVREDASVQQSVLTVKAKDPDDAAVLSYSITSGNVQRAFGIQAKTGTIFVGRQLDYETEQKLYELEITVSDGLFTNITTVTIHVLDANDNSPIFDKNPYIITDVVEEDNNITSTNRRLLVTVSATDADSDRPTSITFSLLGFGTAPPNKYFEIEADTGRLYLLTSLDRDEPNGRPNYQFNIRAQDEPDPPPGSDLDQPQFGYTSVQVKPIDINDNAPEFSSKLEPSVQEDSKKGTPVMTVVAKDVDEGNNARVKYEIVKSLSQNSEMYFAILDENTGLITTNTDAHNLDREDTPTYTITVRASDHGTHPQSTNANVTIKLDDINDNKPVFEQTIYAVKMSEAQQSGEITRVRATDNDIGENARLEYSTNHLDHFDVKVVNNEGSIVVYRAVDYEKVNQRFFNLTVVVQDPDPTHKATAYVEVTVEDFNDNAPAFVVPRIEIQKNESEPVGTFLAHFSANDSDSGINAQFSYYVDRKTDPDRLFSIDDTGNVTIRKMMDREKQDRHDVHILAIDKGDPPKTGTATLIVNVLDVNDNFPIFAENYRPIVMENAKVVPKLVLDVNAIDLDNDPFGAPFGFAANCSGGSETCNSFTLRFNPGGDGGKGNARVSTKRVFDREKQKLYYLPIVMWDMRGSGDSRAMTGINTLIIEIGDVNDNKHSPGHQDIFVYSYKGMSGPMEVGTVYATDPDDWDVVDKTFTFTGPEYMRQYFSVDKDSGVITMQSCVPVAKAHTFTVNVYDRVWGNTEKCTVTVNVQDISEEAVFNSGAVRLKGITAEEFVKRPKASGDITAYDPSKYDKFRTFLAAMLQVPTGNVDILSVQNKDESTDVRYSAHGSPYYSVSKMNSIVALNRAKMQNEVGVQIEEVPIDECAEEKFEGGCYNFLNVTGKPALVNTNGTSFVGVELFIQPMEGCRSDFYPETDQCTADYCYNGGTCSQDDWGELHCECLPGLGFNGPRCQGTHHSFDGNSYALYDPLEQCENSRTSLNIITREENGLILYTGPTADRERNSEEPTDFISLELSAGYPKLRIGHGSGVLELYVDGRDQNGIKMQKLSDGKWHHIDIIRHGREVEMIVDHCDTADIRPGETVRDDKMCRRSDITPDENKFLNVRAMLQIGGRFSEPSYPQGIMKTKFNGCVKYLEHNGKLYDLTVPGSSDPGHPSGANKCTREDGICGANSQGGPVCGDNGICESTWLPNTATCVCKPGYMGDKCTEEATTKYLEKDSFLQWTLKDSFMISSRKLKMNMMFKTRDSDGVLWKVSNTTSNTFITLQILNGRLTLTYNLGNAIRILELYNRVVNNGAWHAVVVERNRGEFILKMDNGEGPNYNITYGFPNDEQEMLIENTVFAGASVSFTNTGSVSTSDLSETCVRDIRMDSEWFPMKNSENSKSKAAVSSRVYHVKDGCSRNDCPDYKCHAGLTCHSLWGAHECRCPEHEEKNDQGQCVPTDYCINHRCCGESTCERDLSRVNNYRCNCPSGWTGEFCDSPAAGPLMGGITPGAIAAIVVSILVLLVLILVIILLVKCREKSKPDDKYILEVDPMDDIRENVIYYDEEGAGEEDQDTYDINRLLKPDVESIHKPPLDAMPRRERPLRNAPGDGPDVGNFIEDRLGDAEDDNDAPPHDSVREFVYEGEGSDAGTLSSLNTTSTGSEQDYDYLNDWGPKFAKLADMYGAGQEPGEEEARVEMRLQ